MGKSWYQLRDHLAKKPRIMLIEENNVSFISRKIKNELYHKYVDHTSHIKKILLEGNQFTLIGETSCVNIDENNEIICFSRTDNPIN
jgi:hypothetical protein